MVNKDYKSLPTVVFAIATLALVAGISVVILGEFQAEQETTTAQVNDSTYLTLNDTFYYLANNATATDFFVRIVNSSVVVAGNTTEYSRTGNWTLDFDLGRISQTSGGAILTGSTVNVSYSYITGTSARDMYSDGVSGILQISSWIDLMALILAVGILLYIVVRVVGRDVGKQKFGGGRY
jgi:hypothetical protein